MTRTKVVWLVVLAVTLPSGAARGEERSFTCPLDQFEGYRDTGLTGAVTIVARTDGAGTIELQGPLGEIALPATRIVVEDTTFFAEGGGTAEMRMPDRAAVDACIAEAERKDPRIMRSRRDADVLRACKEAAPLSADPVSTILYVSVIQMAPAEATAFIKRAYAGEDGDIAMRHDANAMATCTPTPP